METIKKMNLSAIEDRLSMSEMQEIQAGSCGYQAAIAYASLIGTFASIGVPFCVILGAGLTAAAYNDYYRCLGIY